MDYLIAYMPWGNDPRKPKEVSADHPKVVITIKSEDQEKFKNDGYQIMTYAEYEEVASKLPEIDPASDEKALKDLNADSVENRIKLLSMLSNVVVDIGGQSVVVSLVVAGLIGDSEVIDFIFEHSPIKNMIDKEKLLFTLKRLGFRE